MKVYANLKGEWVDITNDYKIGGTTPYDYFDRVPLEKNNFVKIENLELRESYELHVSQIQIYDKIKTSNFTNEERW